MNIPEDHFDFPFPTIDEIARHQAYVVGQEHRERAWILTSWDTWERNPHYQGEPQPHPEDYVSDDCDG